jgi:nitroreductase
MAKASRQEKPLSQAIRERRATPSFDGSPLPAEDLRRILEAGLSAPSEHNVQPWRFIVVQDEEQKRRLRAAAYNQPRAEEASAVIVACGDADAWRKDVDEIVRMGLEGGMPEGYAAQMPGRFTNYFTNFSSDEMHGWLNKMVMIAVTHMMLMAEVMGYDTAALEGFEQEKLHEVLRLPMSYWVVELLAIGHLQGPDKFNGGRFDINHTVFGEEYGKPLK